MIYVFKQTKQVSDVVCVYFRGFLLVLQRKWELKKNKVSGWSLEDIISSKKGFFCMKIIACTGEKIPVAAI